MEQERPDVHRDTETDTNRPEQVEREDLERPDPDRGPGDEQDTDDRPDRRGTADDDGDE